MTNSPPDQPTLQLSIDQLTELLEQVLDKSVDGIIIYRAIRDHSQHVIDFEISHFNQAGRITANLPPDQFFQGQSLLKAYPAGENLFPQFLAVITTGQTFRFDYRYELTGIWYQLTASKLGDGLYVQIRDISQERGAESELDRQRRMAEQQTRQLRATLDASLNGIVAMTARRDDANEIIDFVLDTANESFVRLTGVPLEQAMGQSLLTLFPGNLETGFFDAYRRVVLTGEPEQMTQYYNAGDLEAWFEVSAVRQGIEGVVVTFMDVTQSKLYEQRLQRSNQDLERFAYVASHDLQEPLRKIQAFSDLLRTTHADTLPESGRDLLSRIQAAAQRMQNLIKDLLAFSRISNRETAFAPVSLHQITAEILVDLEEEVRQQNARIDLEPLPVINGDALQLRQLMHNMLTNALKFVPPGLAPHIRLLARPATINDKPKELRGQFVVVEVIDNGIGFDPVFRDKIFQLFQRLHGPDKYAGTGIGLAICQKVAENHGGQISARSTLGEGATFSVLLPVFTGNSQQ